MYEQAALEAWTDEQGHHLPINSLSVHIYSGRFQNSTNQMVESVEDDDMNSNANANANANVTGKMQGGGLKHPVGTKKTKKQLKEGETGQFTDIDSTTSPPKNVFKNVFENVAEESRKRTQIFHQMMAKRIQQEAAKC